MVLTLLACTECFQGLCNSELQIKIISKYTFHIYSLIMIKLLVYQKNHPSALTTSIIGYHETTQPWQIKIGLNTEVNAHQTNFGKLNKNSISKW